ncbi:MAG: hypothetical protein LLG01_11885 [Planctomycetaceae bacterium]|nr:hypothetical protein [Planctomycetaceae bacterium]
MTFLPCASLIVLSIAGALPPAAPQVAQDGGADLVDFARRAMKEYAAHRISPEQVPVPASWTPPPPHTLRAAVTLRSGGNIVSRVIMEKDSLPLSVAAAAIAAIRSEKLPDRVTPEVLAGLTVEVEMMLTGKTATDEELSHVVCGRSGLQLERAGKIARVLPSEAHESGMDLQQMRSACLMQLPMDRSSLAKPSQWSIFHTRHFVALPGQRAKELFRGKLPEAADSATGADRAVAVAQYLIRHQARSGAYRTGEEPAPIREHLAAALAMARLNARVNDRKIQQSVNAAMAYVARQIKRSERTAYVVTGEPADQLAATAYVAMIIAQLPAAPQAQEIAAALLAAISDAAGKPGKSGISCRLDGTTAAANIEDLCLAYQALMHAPQRADATSGTGMSSAQVGLFQQIKAAPAQDAWSQAWKCYVGLSSPADARAAIEIYALDAIGDRRGGIGPRGGEPLVAMTNLFISGEGGSAMALTAEQLKAARRFCAMQMYKGIETYLSPEGEAVLGGVRACPAAAAVSVSACAAAIETFLTSIHHSP